MAQIRLHTKSPTGASLTPNWRKYVIHGCPNWRRLITGADMQGGKSALAYLCPLYSYNKNNQPYTLKAFTWHRYACTQKAMLHICASDQPLIPQLAQTDSWRRYAGR